MHRCCETMTTPEQIKEVQEALGDFAEQCGEVGEDYIDVNNVPNILAVLRNLLSADLPTIQATLDANHPGLYRVVPVEPTDEMLKRTSSVKVNQVLAHGIYKAMIAATQDDNGGDDGV